MAIQEIIKWEGDNKTLIYKFPKEDFNTLSQLIVHESQEAVFFSDGQALDLFGAGVHTLETKNIPMLSKLRNLVSGGVSPFHVEVYFINLTAMLDIAWGTPSQVTVRDPVYGYSYNAGASGSFGLKIRDSRKLLLNLVGTENNLTIGNIQRYFKDLIVTRVKNYVSIELGKYAYNTVNQYLNEISDGVGKCVSRDIASYGIEIINFFVSAIMIRPEDLEELKNLDNTVARKRFDALGDKTSKIILAEGEAQARSIQEWRKDGWENPCYFEGNACVRNALACEGCDEEKIKTEVYDFLKKCYDCAEKELVRVDTELEERYKLYRKEENGRRKSVIINSVLEVVKYLTPVIVFSGVAGILIHNWICEGGFWNIVLSVLAGIIGVKVFFRLLKWGIKNSKMGIKLHKATSGMYDGVITKIVQEQKELFNMAQNYRYLSLVINDRNTFMQYYLSTDYRLHFCTGEEEIRDEEKASIFGYLKTMRERIRTEEREL